VNVYEAIMKSANQVETNPREFDFGSIGVPTSECGSPGCALGWINFYTGTSANRRAFADPYNRMCISPAVLGLPLSGLFYVRMDNLCSDQSWRVSAPLCARTLRLYAAKYHGHEKPPRNFARDLYEQLRTSERIPEQA
jgi:hypothetical protein